MADVQKQSEIRFKVGLDANNIPVDMKWMATDSDHQEMKDCKSIMVSIWDPIEKNALGINLWTNDMMVDEMHAHFFQSIMNLAGSYQQATGNPVILKETKEFVERMAKEASEWENSKRN